MSEHQYAEHTPNPRMAGQHHPAEHQCENERRPRHAAPQVVKDLPPFNQAKHIRATSCPAIRPGGRRRREQPRQNLPIAANPAMLPACIREIARWEVVEQFDVTLFLDAVATLRLLAAPEALAEDLIALLADDRG